MNLAAARLLVCLLLFLGWLGYLAYQAFYTLPQTGATYADGKPVPLVVSRPQALTSDLDVVALVPESNGKEGLVQVTVKEVLYPRDAKVKAGDVLKVRNIAESRSPRRPDSVEQVEDWNGEKDYLLLLKKVRSAKGDEYEVASIPPSPGYRGSPGRVYPATEEALAQYRHILKPTPP
jgi:hypothetical protein